MRKQHRTRHTISLDHKRRLADLAETKPTASAAKALIRKAYVCDNITGCVTRK